jgi:hypothetical protein
MLPAEREANKKSFKVIQGCSVEIKYEEILQRKFNTMCNVDIDKRTWCQQVFWCETNMKCIRSRTEHAEIRSGRRLASRIEAENLKHPFTHYIDAKPPSGSFDPGIVVFPPQLFSLGR